MGGEDAPLLAREFRPSFGAADLLTLPNRHIALRLMIDGTAGTEHNLSMVTEERFATYFRRTNLAGNRVITIALQFKSFDAGTTSARNPRIQVKAVRTA